MSLDGDSDVDSELGSSEWTSVLLFPSEGVNSDDL